MTHKLYTLEELSSQQNAGTWPVAHSSLLATTYKNRYNVAEKMFAKMNETFYNEINNVDPNDLPSVDYWKDENVPDKSYATKYEGPVIGYDVDTMVGPVDWYNEEAGMGDYVERRKLYIYDWTGEKLSTEFPELQYFIDMHMDFKPVLEHYANTCYSNQSTNWQKTLYKLMIIQYNVPTATDNTRVAHRKHNTERFGDEHCDETLGGLHLGENFVEFHAKNTASGAWEHIEGLEENNMLWMFGEHAEQSGWIPAYHGMTPNSNPQHNTRYSIIFDLQARYNGET